MKTRIENVTVVTCDSKHTVYFNSSLTFENDQIIAINKDIDYDVLVDGQNGILLPGMINTHAHLSMIPFRSLQDDLPDRLRLFLFPLEKETMTSELAVSSARIGVAESLLSGVTTVMDMYYYADALATAYDEMGIRAVVAQSIINQDLCDAIDENQGIDLAKQLHQKWKDNPRIHPAFGPHGTTTLTEAGLKKIQDYTQKHNIRLCMHVSEMDYEMDHFKKLNTSPIRYLEKLNLLSKNFTAVHVIHADEEDIEILKKHEVGVAHCIGANAKAAKGVAPLKSFLNHQLNVGLGTDGPASGNTLDLFIQMNLVAKIHKLNAHDRSLFKAKEILHLATLGGAKVLQLSDEIGSLEVGKKADLVLIETKSVNMFPMQDPFSVIVYSANPSNVDCVWIDGIQKVKNKVLVDVDLEDLKRDCLLKMDQFQKKSAEITSKITQL